MFSDNFDRADENLEASANWTCSAAGHWGVRSNKLARISAPGGSHALCPDQGSANHYSQCTNQRGNTSWGTQYMGIRVTSVTSWIAVRGGGGAWQVYKYAGGFNLLGSYSATGANGDVLYLEGSGDSITFKLNGTTRVGPVTDSYNNTVTRQGFVANIGTVADPLVDDFEADVLAGAAATLLYVPNPMLPLLVR